MKNPKFFILPKNTNDFKQKNMAEERQRYSDRDLKEFKELIQQKIEKAEKQFNLVVMSNQLQVPVSFTQAREKIKNIFFHK